MAAYEPVGAGIYNIDALYVQPLVASIYLLVDDGEAAFIETGTAHSMDNVLATLDHLGLDCGQIRYVIPTHVHLDHAGGASAMMKLFPEASLIIHPRGAAHMIDPERLVTGTIGVYGAEKFERLYGTIDPIAESRVRIAKDMDKFALGQRELVFIDTPGHAYHHFCVYDAVSRGVFTGDTFGLSYRPMKKLARGLIPTTPPTQFDPPALLDSVQRIMRFEPQRLYLTHYGEFENPAAQVDSFHRWLDQYVDLCEQIDPVDEPGVERLRQALAAAVLDGLSGADTELEPVLRADIELNAKGLAHWWRRRRRD